MTRQVTFSALALAVLSGCATIVHGPYQDVTIDSNPPGAQATVTPPRPRGPRATTRARPAGGVRLLTKKTKPPTPPPATIRLRRDNSYRVELEKPGYKIGTSNVVSEYDWLWAPVMCGPCEAVGAF